MGATRKEVKSDLPTATPKKLPVKAVPAAPKERVKRTLQDPQDMTPEQLSLALHNCKPLEAWIKAVRSHAFAQLENGTGEVPGWGLGYGVRQRIWREGDEKKLEKVLTKAGLKHEDMYEPEHLRSPAQMEKQLKEHGLWPKKPRNGERPPSIMDEFVEKSMPAKKLVELVRGDDGKYSEAEEEFGD